MRTLSLSKIIERVVIVVFSTAFFSALAYATYQIVLLQPAIW